MQQKHEKEETPKPTEKRNYITKILKGIVYVVIGFIALNLLIYGLLSIPFVQNKVVNFALEIIKEKVKSEVRIDEVQLSLFNNVKLKGIYIEDQSQDTLVYAQNLDVSLALSGLLRNEILIKDIKLENFNANISQQNPKSDFNFQFLIDAFSGDTTSTDTTSSSLKINIENITLKNGKLRYDISSEPPTPKQFNASHIYITDINASIQLPSIDMANLDATISSLSLKEASGLNIENLKANISSDRLSNLYLKNAELTLPKSTLKIPSAVYNLATDEYKIRADLSTISPLDILPFMADLKHLRNDISLQGSLSGKLPAINIDSLIIDYGKDASLRANLSISDYANYGTADLNLNIKQLKITSIAINDFAKIGDSTFILPDILKTLETIRLDGKLQGRLSNFNVDAQAWAKQGAIELKAKASTDTTFQNFTVDAKLQTQNFDLGSLLDMPEIGRLSANLNLIASQSKKQPLKADVTGQLFSLEYNKESYSNIPFTAYYNSEKLGGWLNANLPLGKLEGKIDMTQDKNPKIDIDIDAQQIQIDKFMEFPEWKNPKLDLHLKGYLTGINLSNINADLVIENLRFSYDSLSFEPGKISLQAGIADSSQNYIYLQSSLLNANIKGDYDFMKITDELTNMMNIYLPGVFKKTTAKQKQNTNNFNFSILVNNTEKLGQILNIPVNIIDQFTLTGKVNTIDNTFTVKAKAPRIMYDDYVVKNTVIDVYNTNSLINMTGGSRLEMESGDMLLGLKGVVESDTINTQISAIRDSTDLDMNIQLSALAHFDLTKNGNIVSYLKFDPTFWNVGNLNLSFMPAEIINEGIKTKISNFGFMVGKGRMLNKYFGVDGVISDQQQDTLNISFFQSNLGNILKAFDIDNISTVANGDIKVTGIMDKPEFYTNNMNFSNIIIFNDTLGNLDIKSQWNERDGAIRFYSVLAKDEKKSTVAGRIFPRQDSLNLMIKVDRLSLAWIQPFMSDVLNKVSGSISTGLTAKGKISSPDINGWLGVNDTRIGIDYTNVTYRISDTIEISPDKIGFQDLIVEDPNKNKARINAVVTHKGFGNIQYSLDANLSNFMVLNTAARTDSLFYGKVFASGTVNIKGSDNAIDMKMNIRNGKNSSLNVQIPQTSDAAVYESVVYINTPVDETKTEVVVEPESTLPLKLAVDLNVSPDFLLGVIINPVTGDLMQAKGSGLIKFNYDMESEAMTTFGDYTLSDGFVKMKLQNIANVEFKIREGSKLVFNGNPLKTSFDITAYKRVRADLRTLDQGFGSDQNNSPMVSADAVLGISGNMDKMSLTYNINLPDASDDIQQRVKTLIPTDDERVKQFASLVAAGTFYSSSSIGSSLTGGLLTSVASSALSAGLNAALGGMIGSEWQIGTNLESNDAGFSNMDMSVSLSRKFLDNKLEFNTNLGYRSNQTNGTNNNSLIGDFDVAYALTRSIKLKVFNKTNDTYYKQAPTTQGIGIVYTKEAKTIKELFRFYRKKRNRRNNMEQTTNTK